MNDVRQTVEDISSEDININEEAYESWVYDLEKKIGKQLLHNQ